MRRELLPFSFRTRVCFGGHLDNRDQKGPSAGSCLLPSDSVVVVGNMHHFGHILPYRGIL